MPFTPAIDPQASANIGFQRFHTTTPSKENIYKAANTVTIELLPPDQAKPRRLCTVNTTAETA